MKILSKIVSQTRSGSNYLSFHLRRIIEKVNIREFVGINLASSIFLIGMVIPQVDLLYTRNTINKLTKNTIVPQDTQTMETFVWPLNNFQISQGYHFYHKAVDLTTNFDEPVLAIAHGVVEIATFSNWGYGNYLILSHNNGYFSLYAHLNKILVKQGDQVSQGTTIGTAGQTGWSTGTHLHLEIYSPEGQINPFDVLPKLESKNNTF